MNVRRALSLLPLLAALACGGNAGEDGAAPPAAQGVSVEVAPPFATVAAAATVTFGATVTGTANGAVTWSLAPVNCGSVSPSGLFTAPAAAATCRVVVTSDADPTRSATATVTVIAAPPPPRPGEPPPPTPLVSRGLPAFDGPVSSGTASSGNSAAYDTRWQASASAGWLAYDLSTLPPQRRGPLLVSLFANTSDYDSSPSSWALAPGFPSTYTIDVHPSWNGGAPPAEDDGGWITQAAVTGNFATSRQHLIDATGMTWIRLRVATTYRDQPIRAKLEVFDASQGTEDTFSVYGDSIVSGWANHLQRAVGGYAAGSLGDAIQRLRGTSAPPMYADCAMSGWGTGSVLSRWTQWLAWSRSRFVIISLGANDASWGYDPTILRRNYEALIDQAIAAGKRVIIPSSICYTPGGLAGSQAAAIAANAASVNAVLQAILAARPEVIRGPDQWNALAAHPEFYQGDTVHPFTNGGYNFLRDLWARTLVESVYGGGAQ